MSPAAPAMQAALAAHVTEHVAYLYRRTIEENMGIPMPSPDEELPKSIEMAFSKVVAEAAKKTLQSSIAEIQNQKMNAEAEDPLLKMQERELAIKEMDAQRRASESQQKLQLDTLKIVSDIGFKEKESEIDEIEVAINIITKMLEQNASNANEQAKLQIESAKAGVETIKMVLSGFDSIKDLGILGENK